MKMANTFYTNVFRTQENVNKDNMNYTVADKDQKLSAFFPMPIANANNIFPGVICSGIGTIDNQFGFNSSTNQFTLTAGVLRFPDAISNNTPYSITNQTASISQFLALDIPKPQPQLTTPLVSNTYYLIATLQVSGIGGSYQFTNTPLNPLIPYTIIATNLFTGINQLALCLITISGSGGVTISTDINCAVNYDIVQYLSPKVLFQQGRLNGVGIANSPTAPYDDTSQTGSPTLYFTPTEQGNLISSFNTTTNAWQTQPFNELSLGVSQLVELSALPVGSLVSIGTADAGSAPRGIAISPDGLNVYVANNGANTISQYSINSDGTLNSLGFVNAESGIIGIVVSPDGNNVYVTNYNSMSLQNFTRGSGGLLNYANEARTGQGPFAVAISPDGSSLQVCDSYDGRLLSYSRGGGGALTEIGIPQQTGTTPQGIAINLGSTAYSIYVTNSGTTFVSHYYINVDGSATNIVSSASVGANPIGIAVSSDGNNVYVCNYNSGGAGSISAFTINSDGTLNPLDTYTGINSPKYITISPDGKNAYVTNGASNGQIYEYTRNPGNGRLTYFGAVGAGSYPQQIVMSSNSNYAYVANQGGNTVSEYRRTIATAPTVSLTTPSSTSNVSLSTPIIITFSEQVTGVNTNTVQFQTQGGSLQTITVSDSGNNTYTITGQTLVNGTTYLVIINSGITSVATGLGVASIRFTFSTIPTGPTVQLTSPTSRTNVSLTTPITLTFSVAVTNVTTTTINFKAIGGLPQNISITNSGNNVYTINLPTSLSLSTNYVVEVLQGITGTGQGSPAVVPINFYFSTTFPATVKYDIFVGNNTSNVLTLAKDQFTDSTGTNRQQLANGKWVNAHTIITPSGNNIPPNQGLLVGSVALYNGLVQSWRGNRSIWNLYNQVRKDLWATAGSIDPTSSSNPTYLWTDSITSFRNQNGNNSNGIGRFSFILDLLYNKRLVLLYNGSGVSGLATDTGITGIIANIDAGDGTTPPTSDYIPLSFAIYGNDPARVTTTPNNWHTLSYVFNYNSSVVQPFSNIAVGFNFIQKIEKTFTTGYFSDTGGGLIGEFWS